MGIKSVIGEESQLKPIEENLFQSVTTIPAQIGLVIGKLHPTSDRGFVYGLIPTPPPTDSSQSSACVLLQQPQDKKSKSKTPPPSPSLQVDTEWVIEHARQVSRMLVGGMNVIGVYVWASEASFKASSAILHQIVKVVAQAVVIRNVDERLLVHVSYSPRRWACRSCTATSMSSDFRPCDFKMGRILASLQYFKCTYNFKLRLPIYCDEKNSRTFKDALQTGITYVVKELKRAKPLLDGYLVNEDQQCSSEGPHEVELLLPFMSNAPLEACRSDEIAGVLVFSGTLCACTYLGSKLPLSEAISDIKDDIITSLQSRLDMIAEQSEGDTAQSLDAEEVNMDISNKKCDNEPMLQELRGSPQSILFPKRVLISWLPGIFICDYLTHSDTFEDVKDHCKEMMSMESWSDTNTIIEQEKDAKATIKALSFWSTVSVSRTEGKCIHSSNEGSSCVEETGSHSNLNIFYLISFAVAILSLLIGWYIINFTRN